MKAIKDHYGLTQQLKISGKILLLGLMTFAITVFLTGFYHFAANANKEVNLKALPKADAIVVLTGENSRIYSAMELLEARNGKRLLISGVSKEVSDKTVYEAYAPASAERYCCIDLDRRSLDTKGNAKQTAQWASLHGFKELIVVTSSYHMPRSLEHLRKEMPHLKLIPAQIIPSDLKNKSVFAMMTNPKVFIEYGKLLLTHINLDPVAKYVWTSFHFRNNG